MGTLLLVLITWYLSKVWYERFDIKKPGEGLYLRRFHLVRIKAGTWADTILSHLRIKTRRVFVHHIKRPDADRNLHNHPWTVAGSLILWGGYQEQLNSRPMQWHFAGDWNSIPAKAYHKIVKVLPNTWTLFFAGYRDRSWGFLVDGKHVDWKTYLGVSEDTDLND